MKLCQHPSTRERRGPRRCAPRYLCLLSGWFFFGGTGLVAGQRSRRWDFTAEAERYGPLVKERGLAEVQKQSDRSDFTEKRNSI